MYTRDSCWNDHGIWVSPCTQKTAMGMVVANGCHRVPEDSCGNVGCRFRSPPNSPLRQLWVSLCTPKDSYGCIGCKQVPSCTPKTAVEAYYGCIKVPLDTPKTAMGITVANSYYHVPKRQLLEWWLQAETIVFPRGGGDVAQLVERRTSTPLRQVRFPLRRRIFLPESTFVADSLTVSAHPRVRSHASTSVLTLKIL